jgi:hypothetical protein
MERSPPAPSPPWEGAQEASHAQLAGSPDADSAELRTPIRPSSFRDLVVDFFRLYDPHFLPRVDSLWDDTEGGEEGGTAPSTRDFTRRSDEEIASFLEERYNVPGFFNLYEYNFSSRFFDPLRALYDGEVVPPFPHVRPLDSLHKAALLVPQTAHADAGGAIARIGILHSDEIMSKDAVRKSGA